VQEIAARIHDNQPCTRSQGEDDHGGHQNASRPQDLAQGIAMRQLTTIQLIEVEKNITRGPLRLIPGSDWWARLPDRPIRPVHFAPSSAPPALSPS